MKNRIFTELDVFGNVQFLKVPEFYRFLSDRVDITIPHEATAASILLKERFPADASGIDAYFSQLLNPKKKGAEDQQKDQSIGEFLDSVIDNDDLKLILLGNLGYFHDDPYSLSLAYYSVAQGSYYNGGASFIRGGSQLLSDYLASYIIKKGGKVILNHIVTGFISENDKLTGVTLRKSGSGSELREVTGSEIIANAAMPSVAELLPESNKVTLKKAISKLRPGASLLSIYFGFRHNLKTIGNNHYSAFFFDNSIKSPSGIFTNNKADFKNRSFTFVDYGQVDSRLAPEGKSVGAVCCIDYCSGWDKLTKAEYTAKKREVANIFISRLEKHIPGITGEIEYYEVGTPLTVRRYTLNPEGAVYGFARLPGIPPADTTGLPDNLHFASAWGKTGGGFSGVIYSGYLCALNILRKRNQG
jgi:phytoene dehydrogenase-like protein